MAEKKEQRLNMRISGDLKARLEGLMKKKGLDRSGVVNVAVSEMHEREFPIKEKRLSPKAQP